ncbi:MAG TPA: protein kinase [Leifsonia sp.]|nr:protein kinase [Leifsonia sp.]
MTRPAQNLARRATTVALRNGWEVVRPLTDDNAEVRLLVDPGGASGPAELCVRASGDETETRTLAEITALRATRSEHVVRLLDVVPVTFRRREDGSAPQGILVEHAPGGDLSRLLGRRSSMRAGEAATILLSVAHGLEALHDSGWAHGGVTPRAVVFRRDGCPAIASLANARPLTSSALDEDRRSFLRLTEQVTASIARGEGERMFRAVHEALADSDWEGVARAVTEEAEPEAVLLPVDVPDPGPPPRPATEAARRLAVILDGHPVTALVGAIREWLQGRKKLVAVVGVPLAVVALMLALMPARGVAPGMTPVQTPMTTPTAALGQASGETPSPRVSKPETAPSSPNAIDDAEDPVPAAQRLLDARHACYAAPRPSAQCLESSVEPGSRLFQTDSAALGETGASEARDLRGAVLELSQQWGDAALVSISGKSKPASLLLVRGEAGWRIREVYP